MDGDLACADVSMASWFSRPSRGRRVDGVRPRRRGTAARRRGTSLHATVRRAADGRTASSGQNGAAPQRQPAGSAPSEGASEISDSGGHEQRRSAAKEQSHCSSSVPALPHTREGRPWCKNSRLSSSAIQKKALAAAPRDVLRSCSARLARAITSREVGCVACGLTPPSALLLPH